MAFDPAVIAYLDSRDYLTQRDRERIIEAIFDELGSAADKFLERNPHPFLPNCYWYDYGLMTESLVFRQFEFACNAEGHVYGVTEVLYADELPPEDDGE